MTDPNYTVINFVINGNNNANVANYIDAVAKHQLSLAGKCSIKVVQFDGNYCVIQKLRSANRFPKLKLPAGNGKNALYDSVCQAIDELGIELDKMNEAKRPGKVMFLLVNQVADDSSTRFNLEDLTLKVKHQAEVYGWEFIQAGEVVDTSA